MENTEEKNGAYLEFRDILKKGMGSRTVTAFADEAGIGRTTMSRLLNQDEIPRPKEDTIEKIAKVIKGVSIDRLRESVGYPPADMHKVAMDVHNHLVQMKNEYFMKDGGCVMDSIENAMEMYALLYAGSEDISWHIFKDESDKPVKTARVLGDWEYGDYDLETVAGIRYIVMEGGSVYITDFAITQEEIKKQGWTGEFWKPFLDPTEKELKYIFTDSMTRCLKKSKDSFIKNFLDEVIVYKTGEKYPLTYHGFGFYYRETPPGFQDFLTKYRALFCTSEKNTEMYQEMVSGKDPDKAFSKYKSEASEEWGTGAVVADIMSKVYNMTFIFERKDEFNEEDDSCVAFVEDDDRQFWPPDFVSMRFMKDLSETAELLGIKEYGLVYHTMYTVRKTNMTYSTDTPIANVPDVDTFITKKEAERYLAGVSEAGAYRLSMLDDSEKSTRMHAIVRRANDAKRDLEYLNTRYQEPMSVPVSKEDVALWKYIIKTTEEYKKIRK